MQRSRIIKFIFYLFVLILIFLSSFTLEVNADTVYLKNGRRIEGIIKSEDESSIKLDIGFGTVGFRKDQIERISRSSPEEAEALFQKWDKEKVAREQKAQMEKIERENRLQEETLIKEQGPKQVEVARELGHMFVDAKLNKKVNVRLMVDTGASVIVLTNKIARVLGIDTAVKKKDNIQLQLGDGRKIDAKHVTLENVRIQGVEADNVDAAVLLEDVGKTSFSDGLLGMSFLSRFNFKFDQDKKALILERLK